MAKTEEDKRNIQNNANVVNNAADVAIASGHPVAAAAGGAVKAGDKLTGGKVSETAGKALNAAGKTSPGGKQMQKGLNRASESGMADGVGNAARMYNGAKGKGSDLAKEPTGKNNMSQMRRGQGKSSSNASETEEGSSKRQTSNKRKIAGVPSTNNKKDDDKEAGKEEESIFGSLSRIQKIIMILLPALLLGFIILLLLSMVSVVLAGDFMDPIGAGSVSNENIGIATKEDEDNAKEQQKYYERINKVKKDFMAKGKNFESTKIIAVFRVIMDNNKKIDYDDISVGRIKKVANAMFRKTTYDEAYFKENLKNDILPSYIEGLTDEEADILIEEIFEYIEDYYDYIELEKSGVCGTNGSCEYNIKGFQIGGANVTNEMNISNLKVRLMQCGGDYGTGDDETPIDQPLVDFEDYVAGVVYAEIGEGFEIEAMKAQAIMARSYALARPTAMGNSNGKKLEQENGQWILQIASCVSDQVFCNINEGCSYMGGGDGQGGYVVSGVDASGSERSRPALAQDSPLRTAVAATKGELLINEQGYIISTGYLADVQNEINSLAQAGFNYQEILFKIYSDAKDIEKSSCTSSCSSSTGEYSTWKQYDPRWASVPLGVTSTIKEAGCLATSVAILIAKSGIQTPIADFNPGTFVTRMNEVGGFTYEGDMNYGPISTAVPQFNYVDQIYIYDLSREEKLATIKSYLDQGYYISAEVRGNTGQHWVAIDAVNGDTILMMDPATESTNMWEQYQWSETKYLNVFRVG